MIAARGAAPLSGKVRKNFGGGGVHGDRNSG
jgi:hypothetical protein